MRVAGVEMTVVEVVREVEFPWGSPDVLVPSGWTPREYLAARSRDLLRVYRSLTEQERQRAVDEIRPPWRVPSTTTDPVERRDAAELTAYASTRRLPPRMRAVFDLCVRDRMTNAACAAQLGIATTTVRTQMRLLRLRARREGAAPSSARAPTTEARAREAREGEMRAAALRRAEAAARATDYASVESWLAAERAAVYVEADRETD
jgi:hypothetical protein